MAIKALNLEAIVDYVSDLDTDDDDKTIWKLGALSSRDIGIIRDATTSISFKASDFNKKASKGKETEEEDITTNVNRSKQAWEACRRGLKGWDNFLHPETDKPVHFKTVVRDVDGVKRGVVPNDLLNIIPPDVLLELGGKIMDMNTLSSDTDEDKDDDNTIEGTATEIPDDIAEGEGKNSLAPFTAG